MSTATAKRFAWFVLGSLATRGAMLGVEVLKTDEVIHLLGGRALLRGELYVGFVDNKPPLNHLFFALGDALGGMAGVHLLAVLLVIPLTALAASAFFGHDRRGLWAGLGWLLYSVGFNADDFLAVNSELMLLAPATWGLALVGREDAWRSAWRPLAAGALIGLATLFKPQGAAWGAAMAVALLPAGRRALPPLALLMVGFALPLLATAALFAGAGDFAAFLHWNVTYNLHYSANPILAVEACWRAARVLQVGAFVLPLLLVLPSSLALLPAYPRRLLVCALVATIPAVAIGLRFFHHYFLLFYPLLAIAAAPAAERLAARLRDRRAQLFFAWPVGLALLFTVLNVCTWYRPARPENRPVLRAVARRLAVDACAAGGSLFVWGSAPELYLASGLRTASRFVAPQGTVAGYLYGNWGVQQGRVASAHLVSAEHRALLLEDLERSRVTYVVDLAAGRYEDWEHFPMSGFPELAALVARDLEPLAEVEGIRIHRRRGCGTR